jgi:hypothetical protein
VSLILSSVSVFRDLLQISPSNLCEDKDASRLSLYDALRAPTRGMQQHATTKTSRGANTHSTHDKNPSPTSINAPYSFTLLTMPSSSIPSCISSIVTLNVLSAIPLLFCSPADPDLEEDLPFAIMWVDIIPLLTHTMLGVQAEEVKYFRLAGGKNAAADDASSTRIEDLRAPMPMFSC